MLYRSAAFLLGLFSCLIAPTLAGEPLRVALLHSEPWAYYSPDGPEKADSALAATGIMVEITRALSKESGLEFKHALTPYARIWRDIKAGDCDLTYGIRTSERDPYVRYAGHLFTFDTIVVGRPGVKLKSIEDMNELRVGVLGDVRLNLRFNQDSRINWIELRDYETMVDMLLAGRLDAVAGNSVSLVYLLQKRKQAVLQWPQLALEKMEVWAQFSQRSVRVSEADRISEAIDRLRRKGYFDSLLARYTGKAWPEY